MFGGACGLGAAAAAAAGVPPLVARHSGLAEIAAGLEASYPEGLRHLVSFEPGDVRDLRSKLEELLALPGATRRELGSAARDAVVRLWSWSSVSERLLSLHLG
jgi:glycosyltransferase involved in cell wall biosynthesis